MFKASHDGACQHASSSDSDSSSDNRDNPLPKYRCEAIFMVALLVGMTGFSF
jgi:hypothetical protein